MKKIYNILLVTLLAIAFTSCEKVFFNDDVADTPTNVIEYLWDQVDKNYSFFDIKGVDWDSVREVYLPQVDDEMDQEALFSVCAAMLNTLRDGHTNLMSDFDVSHNDTVFYKMYAEKNIDESVVALNYLTPTGHTTGSFKHNAIRDGKVAYLRYTSFLNDIYDTDYQYVMSCYKDCEGMILDLRQNGGGNMNNIAKLLSIFDNHKQLLYTTQVKSGPGHDEFCEPLSVYASDTCILEEPYAKKFAVLVDRGSFSATSFFSLCTQAYDNIMLFGDTTGGGTGLPNGGMLPNGWSYRFSTSRAIALDGGNYENGVPVQRRVLLDPASTAAGIDDVIEAAADWVLE
ncbi:MAG: S41 family peptidase [Bacteroidales bacterium]|nr:S41 family peptidase [Bacteroidales bacterium]